MLKAKGSRASSLRACLRKGVPDTGLVTVPDSVGLRPPNRSSGGKKMSKYIWPRWWPVLLGLLVAILVGGAAVGLTRAYFSDTATAAATFSTGTTDLKFVVDSELKDNVELEEMTGLYPGWTETVTLRLRNNGNLNMEVFITAQQVLDEGLGAVVEVEIYRGASSDPSDFLWSGTFDEFEALADPVSYGELKSEAEDDVTFVFAWPDDNGDDNALLDKSLQENIIFTGTTEGVSQ